MLRVLVTGYSGSYLEDELAGGDVVLVTGDVLGLVPVAADAACVCSLKIS